MSDLQAVASYRSRATSGKWKPEEDILRHVSLVMRVPASSILRKRVRDHKISLARHAWITMLVQFLPRQRFYTAKNGSVRRAADRDGNNGLVARLLDMDSSGVRYAVRRIEDLRDDPAFDERLEALEERLAARGGATHQP